MSTNVYFITYNEKHLKAFKHILAVPVFRETVTLLMEKSLQMTSFVSCFLQGHKRSGIKFDIASVHFCNFRHCVSALPDCRSSNKKVL